ncbi:MAG: PHB depolymerase family esterase [Acidobacteriaceae bacterium]|nr:PHB depolymerase family esterase [Acidobacteriaceae bacterium]
MRMVSKDELWPEKYNQLRDKLRQGTQLTRAQNLMEATQVIQRALSGRGHAVSPGEPSPENSRLGEVSKLLRQTDLPSFPLDSAPLAKFRKTPPVTIPDGAAYVTRTFACEAGSRDYKLYIPSHLDGRKLPLLIMLHGCTQNPDDFAVGTRMNQLAEEHGFVIAYPRQSTEANQLACWNWFNPKDQRRDLGEPSIIAGITRTVMAELNIDAERIFVAGLSAGGAMAEIMSATYPELYAATGIHSGLAYGSATDAASAFAAMSGASSPVAPPQRKRRLKKAQGRVRTIVFHGTSDQRVHPSNAEMIFAEARAGLAGTTRTRETQHQGSAGGRAYTRTVILDASGVPQVEHWSIEGLGHAWSGGCPDGSYTDRHGPDASREMLRFFLEIPSRRRKWWSFFFGRLD